MRQWLTSAISDRIEIEDHKGSSNSWNLLILSILIHIIIFCMFMGRSIASFEGLARDLKVFYGLTSFVGVFAMDIIYICLSVCYAWRHSNSLEPMWKIFIRYAFYSVVYVLFCVYIITICVIIAGCLVAGGWNVKRFFL